MANDHSNQYEEHRSQMLRHLQREMATREMAETTACASSIRAKEGRFDDGIPERKPKSKPIKNRAKSRSDK